MAQMLHADTPMKAPASASIQMKTVSGATADTARKMPMPRFPTVANVLRTLVGEPSAATQRSDSFPKTVDEIANRT